MPVRVYVPSLLRPLCGGEAVVEGPAGPFGALLRAIDQRCPGFYARMVDEGRLRPDLAVAVNGEIIQVGLHEVIPDGSEIAVVPAIGGG